MQVGDRVKLKWSRKSLGEVVAILKPSQVVVVDSDRFEIETFVGEPKTKED